MPHLPLHIPHPAWCGQCPPAPSSLGWPMRSPAGNWGGGGGEEGLVSPSPFSASTTPAHLPSGNSSATSPREGGYPVGSPTRHLCLEQPLHLPPGINLSRVPHHCLARTLTDRSCKVRMIRDRSRKEQLLTLKSHTWILLERNPDQHQHRSMCFQRGC